MRVSRRMRFAAATAGLLAVAIPLTASATQPTVPAKVGSQVQTRLSFNRHTLLVSARGRVLTLAMQMVGTEYWQDAEGYHAVPLQGSPTSIEFGSGVNVVGVPIHVYPGATVVVSFTTQGANTAALGSASNASTCHGDTVVTDHGRGGITYITSRTC